MKIAIQSEKIFIASHAVDFRHGIDGLCTLVVENMQQNLKNNYFRCPSGITANLLNLSR